MKKRPTIPKTAKPAEEAPGDAQDNDLSHAINLTAEELPMPTASELATLAAVLSPDSPPDEGTFEKAMTIHIQAAIFLLELPTTVDALLLRFMGDRYLREGAEWCDRQVWETEALTYNPRTYSDPEDPFRVAIDGSFKQAGMNGNAWKTPRAMTKNIDDFCEALDPIKHPLVGAIKRELNEETVYVIPHFLVERLVGSVKLRRSKTKQKSWQTRQKKAVKRAGKKGARNPLSKARTKQRRSR